MSKTNSKKSWLISRTELDAWLDGLAQKQTLIAPREVARVVMFRPITKSSEIVEGFSRPTLSIKEVFFPPTERLLNIEKKGATIKLSETLPEGQAVVFGVRPCDARGARLLDALFLNTVPTDPYYARRRTNTTLVGMACKEPGPSCFCTSVGGAPDDPTGMDVMLNMVEGGFLIEAFSEKGHALLTDAGWQETVIGGSSQVNGGQFSVPGVKEWPEHFSSDYWTRISERCLSCRACSYVCPTCRCFAVRDEVISPVEYERIRCWDACMGENYRRVAGGHKPRAEKSERLRNRIFCKFYYYPEQYGLGTTWACTGCGRCIDVCPAGVDITEILMDLEKQS